MTVPPFQDIATLAANICLSPSTIERRVAAGEFPKPCRLGGKRLWEWAKVHRFLTGKSKDVGQTDAEKLEAITNATRDATERRA